MNYKIVMITGTKGKTTVAYLIDSILLRLGTNKETLRVDTEGHYVNGRRYSTFDDSHRIYGFAPTVCPGRYCQSLKSFEPKRLEDTVAILECSLGSGGVCGTGIKESSVGVWTNVLEDHLGSSDSLKSREDIANAKDFIFRQIGAGGYAVFNACDDLVCSKVGLIRGDVKKIPCVFDEAKVFFDLEKHLKSGGEALMLRGSRIMKKNIDGERLIYDASNLPWAFEGQFKPSMMNLVFALGAVYSIHNGHFPRGLDDVIDGIRLDPYGGRLTLLKAKKGTTIIADYAHETESLISVGELARMIAERQGGKTIGIVRLSYDRSDKLIKETGQAIGGVYDELVVYDKIDGHFRNPERRNVNIRFKQGVGRVARLFGAAIRKKNKNVKIIIREDKALEYVVKEAGENDVVVAIVNDPRRSIDWIREKFDAKFLR